ncbi:hypothetical protein [Paenibacillus sp.]|uniref:hypothetical protein n=1 Tax=Paenibacillus sp. TaxID=58172 RepID=UPI00281826B5|nr:hypothetical protein [Paenibacillus sp.]MDR0266773.1 hypothetical protein [Paenibacillus sp.]
MKRMASRIGTVILPDVTMDAARIYFGVPDFSWGKDIKASSYAMIQDHSSYLSYKAQTKGTDEISESDWISYRVTSNQYFQVGENVGFKRQIWVITESVITYEHGILQHEYVLVKRNALRRKSRLNQAIQGVSLEGRVLKRANNMVKVHLDIDDEHDDQSNWWFPYSPEGNNIFHCMPEEGARIKVYFPNGVEKKAIAINSTRGGGEEMKSRTVFQKPTTKVFHMPGEAKMELGDDGVLFEKGTVRIHLDQNDVRIEADQYLIVTASNQLELGSKESPVDSIKMTATDCISFHTMDKQIPIAIMKDYVGITSAKVLFKKVEMDFIDMLKDEELKELYIDELFSEHYKNLGKVYAMGTTSRGTNFPKPDDVRKSITEQVAKDPNALNKARERMSTYGVNELKGKYIKKFVDNPEEKKEKKKEKTDEDRIEERDKYQTAYNQYKNEMLKRYEEKKEKAPSNSEDVVSKQTPEAIPAETTPKTPAPEPNLIGNIVHAFFKETEPFFKEAEPFFKEVELRLIIPQKPNYVAKTIDDTILYSRYTFFQIGNASQRFWAEVSIVLGTVALVASVFTFGATASVAVIAFSVGGALLSVADVAINVQKLNDLDNADYDTDPTFWGMNQDFVNIAGLLLGGAELSHLGLKALLKSGDLAAGMRQIDHLDDVLRAEGGIAGRRGNPKFGEEPPSTSSHSGGTDNFVKAGSGATFEGKAGRDYSRFAIDDPSPANVKNAEDYLKMTRNGDVVEPHEWGLIFDKNGNPISKLITDYHSGKIDISKYQDLCKEGVYTHNHPNNGVFSWQDLETARGFDMAEIRATLPNGTTLSIKRGSNGWNWDNIDTQITLNKAKQNVLTKPEYAELLRQRDQSALDMAWMKEFAELMGGSFSVYK